MGFTSIQPGDVNDDSVLNVIDIIAIVNLILSNEELFDLDYCRADLNGDSSINIQDIISLVNLILN